MTDHKTSTSLLEDRFDTIPVKRGKGNSENSSLHVQLEISMVNGYAITNELF